MKLSRGERTAIARFIEYSLYSLWSFHKSLHFRHAA